MWNSNPKSAMDWRQAEPGGLQAERLSLLRFGPLGMDAIPKERLIINNIQIQGLQAGRQARRHGRQTSF